MAGQAQLDPQASFVFLGVTLSSDLIAPGALIAVASCIFGLILKIIIDDTDRIRLFFLLEETLFWTAYRRFLNRLSGASTGSSAQTCLAAGPFPSVYS